MGNQGVRYAYTREYVLSVVGHWLGRTHVSELVTRSEIVLFYPVTTSNNALTSFSRRYNPCH